MNGDIDVIATHVTFNESDASKVVTQRNFKSRNAHFRDNAHALFEIMPRWVDVSFRSVSSTNLVRLFLAKLYGNADRPRVL